MLSKASPSLMDAGIVNSISRFCSAAKADEVEASAHIQLFRCSCSCLVQFIKSNECIYGMNDQAFFAANPLSSSERRISQQLESMRTSAKMVDMIASSNLSKAEYWA